MKHRKLWVSLVAVLLAVLMVGGVLFSALSTLVSAASSSALKTELDNLKSQADDIAAESSRLEQQIAENESETQSIVDKKANIDQQMELTRRQIENLSSQIQQYNLLIAAKQEELDQAEADADEMNERYKLRIRTMEEQGGVSYWSILFRASDFTDLLDRIDMISEIAASDQAMLGQLKAAAQAVADAKAEIEEDKSDLEATKADMEALQEQLDAQRAEADELIAELTERRDELQSDYETYDALEQQVREQIADVQRAYEDALADEEAARKIAEARQQASSGSIPKPSSSSSSGFIYPLAASATITDTYGMRYHPIYGYYKMHSGLDLAVGYGTAIYAAKSGTVVDAAYNKYNGNYVTINHNDGYTTTYAHMDHSTVSVGQTVSQGEVIGYVGTSGYTTGAHLHIEVTYGGSTVNPAEYIPIG